MKHHILLPRKSCEAFAGDTQQNTNNNQWQLLEIDDPSDVFSNDALDAYLAGIKPKLLAAAKVLVKDFAHAIKSRDTNQIIQASITLFAFIRPCTAIGNKILEHTSNYDITNKFEVSKPGRLLDCCHFFPTQSAQEPLINQSDLDWYITFYKDTLLLQNTEIRTIKTKADDEGKPNPFGVCIFDAFSPLLRQIYLDLEKLHPTLLSQNTNGNQKTKNTAPIKTPRLITYENCQNFLSAVISNFPQAVESLIIQKYTPTSALGKRYLSEQVTKAVEKQFTYATNGPTIEPQTIATDNVAKYCRLLDELSDDIAEYKNECSAQIKTTHQTVATSETAIQSKQAFAKQLAGVVNNDHPTVTVSATLAEIKRKLLTREEIIKNAPESSQQQTECFSLSKLWEKACTALNNLYYSAASLYFTVRGDPVSRDTCDKIAKQPHQPYYEAKLYCRLFQPQRVAPKKVAAQNYKNTTKNIVFRHL